MQGTTLKAVAGTIATLDLKAIITFVNLAHELTQFSPAISLGAATASLLPVLLTAYKMFNWVSLQSSP